MQQVARVHVVDGKHDLCEPYACLELAEGAVARDELVERAAVDVFGQDVERRWRRAVHVSLRGGPRAERLVDRAA